MEDGGILQGDDKRTRCKSSTSAKGKQYQGTLFHMLCNNTTD